MPADVAGDFPSPRQVADQDRVLEVEGFDKRGEVIGVRVDVVPVPGLIRSSVPPSVVGDGAVAVRGHGDELVVPGVGAQRPAVAEDDGLPPAPVLVEDADAVFGGDKGHGMVSLFADPLQR